MPCGKESDHETRFRTGLRALLIVVLFASRTGQAQVIPLEITGEAWKRHTIDSGSRGADGVRLADVNGDSLPDFVTGWEEGGEVRICLHPGRAKVRSPWLSLVVGKVGSPEDAVFVDLDGDGHTDVVSCCEGKTKSVFVHWSPQQNQFASGGRWQTQSMSVLEKKQQWMFALPVDVDGVNGTDLVVGSKGVNASVGWLRHPKSGRNLENWTWHKIADAGWIMSIVGHDVDGDGDQDLVISDRKGNHRGVWWLDNPGTNAPHEGWARRKIGALGHEVMFIDVANVDGDGRKDVVASVKPRQLIAIKRIASEEPKWESTEITLPSSSGTAKGSRVGDINGDGRADIVCSCEHANGKSGVFWLDRMNGDDGSRFFEISGKAGTKFDLLQLVDLDLDGDLDVITCEERENLGVIWYENPHLSNATQGEGSAGKDEAREPVGS